MRWHTCAGGSADAKLGSQSQFQLLEESGNLTQQAAILNDTINKNTIAVLK